ncbi:MAG TPA: hypothetical protein DCP90_06530 [Clostridiales bacterium]|nr:MAG: hypothetical protein A2Y22_00745 [Clostridiales bacterium GWD2_32_59]HAN10249.1 hypothetical protein [Clostridiales bacterium]
MKKGVHTFEVFLTSNCVSAEVWERLLFLISKYVGRFSKWTIYVKIDLNEVRYFVETHVDLPATCGELKDFLLAKVDNFSKVKAKFGLLYVPKENKNFLDIYEENEIRYSRKLRNIEISIIAFKKDDLISKVKYYFETNRNIIKRVDFFSPIDVLLSIDFSSYNRFFYKKPSKYLNIQKSLHLLKSDKNNSILKIDTFPYLQGDFYLNQNNYNFDKHSIVIGASGTGKSKLISLLIDNIEFNTDYRLKYKVIVIDPHADLENDIGGLPSTTVLNFKSLENSADLFTNSNNDIISSTELILSILKTLIADRYNSKLERMLRYSIYLLLTKKAFTFLNMRKLIIDTEYRNLLVKELERMLPTGVVEFFLTEFNDLKTKSFDEAISPIISFIDQMQLIPVFNSNARIPNVNDFIENNFLTIFSLDRNSLGEKVVKTIVGLVMQQILQIVQTKTIKEHIILVIDEVSVVENPIISRFLSEARKYGVSVILGGQYFNQISDDLKDSIFANVINYYIFRVSRLDATVLEENVMMNLAVDNSKENRIKILTDLNDRECIARLSSRGMLIPAFKAKTVEFASKPRKIIKKLEPATASVKNFIKSIDINKEKQPFTIGNVDSLRELMISQSSSRKKVEDK